MNKLYIYIYIFIFIFFYIYMRMHIDAQIDQDIRSVLEWEVHSFRYVQTHTYHKFARVHVCVVKCCKVMPMIRRTRDINQFRDKNWFSFASLLANIMKFHVSAAARNMAGSRQACIALTGICRAEWHLISKGCAGHVCPCYRIFLQSQLHL